jgi:hypothetical protein
MKLPAMLILAGLLLTIGAAAFGQGNASSGKFAHRGWLGRPTYTGFVDPIHPKQNSRRGSGDADGTEQALEPESSVSPTLKSDR